MKLNLCLLLFLHIPEKKNGMEICNEMNKYNKSFEAKKMYAQILIIVYEYQPVDKGKKEQNEFKS